MGTPIKVNDLAFRLIGITVVSFDQLYGLHVATRTSLEVWGMLSGIGGRVIHDKLVTAGSAMIVPHLWPGEGNALGLI